MHPTSLCKSIHLQPADLARSPVGNEQRKPQSLPPLRRFPGTESRFRLSCRKVTVYLIRGYGGDVEDKVCSLNSFAGFCFVLAVATGTVASAATLHSFVSTRLEKNFTSR